MRSEGAKVGNVAKIHKYEMFIKYTDVKEIQTESDFFKCEGKSAVNFISGSYQIINLGALTTNISFSSRIGVHNDDLKYENKFLDFLNGDISYRVSEDFLELKSRTYSQDELSTPIDEVLIFRKK